MENLVTVVNENIVVSSRDVAEHFGKEHRDVLKAIRHLVEGVRKSSQTPSMFHETTYVNEQNKQAYSMYLMNRDGFSLLVMGFTGAKALEWKLKYIEAFNQMEKELNNVRADVIRKEAARNAGINARKELTPNIIKARCDGMNQKMIGITIGKWTNYIYQAIFDMKANEMRKSLNTKSIRDCLTTDELDLVDGAETMCSLMLKQGKDDAFIRNCLRKTFGIQPLVKHEPMKAIQ
mgnify:CR=1 FL=1|nr:MAG TPA: regulatory protein [Caudoviricetes sp.]